MIGIFQQQCNKCNKQQDIKEFRVRTWRSGNRRGYSHTSRVCWNCEDKIYNKNKNVGIIRNGTRPLHAKGFRKCFSCKIIKNLKKDFYKTATQYKKGFYHECKACNDERHFKNFKKKMFTRDKIKSHDKIQTHTDKKSV